MNDIGGINHIALTVRDIDRSVAFYESNFGFKKSAGMLFTAYVDGFFGESEDARELYGVPEGSVCHLAVMEPPSAGPNIELFQFVPQKPAESVPWDRTGITHFSFESGRFDALIRRLQGNGVKFCMHPGIRVADGLKWVFVRDPDGNMIEILGSNDEDV